MSRRTRVVVLFGGRSGEHLVSCISARHVVAAMDPARYEVLPIGIALDGTWLLPDASRKVLEGGELELPDRAFEATGEQVSLVAEPGNSVLVPSEAVGAEGRIRPDVVFPVLHGPYGEDGTVQGLLEMADLPYVGAGVLGSALAMDKEKAKKVLAAHGIPLARYEIVRAAEWGRDEGSVMERLRQLGPVVFTKPANLGSSVGITRCSHPGSLKSGIQTALQYDRKVVVEEAIEGRELECAVLGNDHPETSVVGEIIAARDFYDYQAKYVDPSSKTEIPADIPDQISREVRRLSSEAFLALDIRGMARVDFFYEEHGRGVILNEVNTIPGFTTISMYPKLWEASGLGYSGLIDRLIELAIEHHAEKIRPEDHPPPKID